MYPFLLKGPGILSIKTEALTCNSSVSFGASRASEPPDNTGGP